MPLLSGYVAPSGHYSLIASLATWLAASITDEKVVAFRPLPPLDGDFPLISISEVGLMEPPLSAMDFSLDPDPTGWGTAGDLRGVVSKTLIDFRCWVNLEQKDKNGNQTGGDIKRSYQMADKVMTCIRRSGHSSQQYGGSPLLNPPSINDYTVFTAPVATGRFIEFDYGPGALQFREEVEPNRPSVRSYLIRQRVVWWESL